MSLSLNGLWDIAENAVQMHYEKVGTSRFVSYCCRYTECKGQSDLIAAAVGHCAPTDASKYPYESAIRIWGILIALYYLLHITWVPHRPLGIPLASHTSLESHLHSGRLKLSACGPCRLNSSGAWREIYSVMVSKSTLLMWSVTWFSAKFYLLSSMSWHGDLSMNNVSIWWWRY